MKSVVMPADAGIQKMDSRRRGNDGLRVAALAGAVLLAGCGASATQNWRTAPDLAAPVWKITGTQGPWGATKIFINEQPVLEGRVSIFSGTGELTGVYENRPVIAKCKKGRSSQVRTQCEIKVDGRKATTLYFRVK